MNRLENWYQTFFDGLAMELWDKAIPPHYTTEEVRFIKQITAIKSGSSILDIPCGSGRHSIAFAKEGYKVTAIDIAEENIRTLNRNAQSMELTIQAITADMLKYSLQGEYNLALCLGNSFCYFSHDPLLAFARKINCALSKDGWFIIQTGTLAESILPTMKQKDWMQLEDLLFLVERIYHTDSSILQSNYHFIKQDQAEHKTAYHFIFTFAEIKRLLTNAGFNTIEAYSSFDKKPFAFGDQQAFIIARK